MDTVPTSFDRAAQIALAALRPEARVDVLVALGRLATEPLGAKGATLVGTIGASPGLRVLRAGKRLRVLVSIEPGHITVREIVSQAMGEEYRRQAFQSWSTSP
jgi:hypothetical protein